MRRRGSVVRSPFRRSPFKRSPFKRFPFEAVQALESRRYFAGPSLDPIPDQTIPIGKSIEVPLTAIDSAGDPLTYSISDNKAAITTDLHPSTDTWLQLSTTQGTMLFELFDDIAPNTVATMKGLVESGFFNGLTFHRIVKNFVVQGGDPKGDGSGGPGFTFDDEFDPNTIFSGNGQLAMANSGKDTNGSQFFITKGPQRFLDFNHTIWGQLVRGFSTFNKLLDVPVEQQPNSTEISKPVTTQKIKSATIVTDTTDAVLQVNVKSRTTGQVTVTVTDADGGTSQQTFNVYSQTDTTNDPPILLPVADQYVGKNKTLTFTLNSIDPDGGDVEYGYELVDTLHGSASIAGDEVTFVPKKNYVGPVDLVVGVKTKGATTRGSLSEANNDIIYDTQQIRIAVGDYPGTGQAAALNALAGSTLTNISVATFTDSDPTGSAANWSADVTKDASGNSVGGINWGDDTITNGTVVANANGTFSVIGSHTYGGAGDYPISITVNGDKGARILMSGTVHVTALATLAGGVLTVNGTAGNDIINLSESAREILATLNGTTEKFDAASVQRCEIYAGDGNDTVTIGTGVPGTYIDGAGGNDFITGGDGNDTITGGSGKNTLSGANGDDRLNGSGGHDVIYGGNGDDRIYGNGGDDTLEGGNGVDHLWGGDGNDLLIGGGSNDKLYGEAGNDKLIGGAGADFEDGGPGIDSAVGDALDTNVNIETIL